MNSMQGAILIVDDDPLIRSSLKDIFSELSECTAETAADPFDAMQKLNHKAFDIVFSDIMMPGMNGIDFLKRIKQQDPTISVVMITGFPTVDVAIHAMKEGAVDFLTKPFRIDEIRRIVTRLVQERRLLVADDRHGSEVHHKKTIEALNRNLTAKINEITMLHEINESFLSVRHEEDVNGLYTKLVKTALEISGGIFSAFMIIDRQKGMLIPTAACGLQQAKQIPLQGDFFCGMLKKKQPSIITNRENPFLVALGIDTQKVLFSACILLPLIIKNEVYGLLLIGRQHLWKQFTKDDILLLQNLVRKASLAIENKLLNESVYNNIKNTLHSLVAVIEARDKYTLTHSLRVTDYALQIALALGCSQEETDILNSAGHLHDIGKIGISDTILLKQTRLSDQEYKIIRQHPVIGEHILKPLGFLTRERDIIRYHHERWDGNGYPEGLQGEEIPLLSRILAVADSFDAMTTDRPYKKALSFEKAVHELLQNKSQFDQNVVNAFVGIIDGNQMKKNSART